MYLKIVDMKNWLENYITLQTQHKIIFIKSITMFVLKNKVYT